MAEDQVMRLLAEQRKRAIATIMGSLERSCWSKLNPDERELVRGEVISAFNVFYDLIRDVLKVNADDTVRNEMSLRLLEQVHAGQQRIERELTRKERRAS